MNRNSRSTALAVLFTSVFAVAHVFAQVTGGTIEGSVTDPSGARIPGAMVTVTNVDTGVHEDLPANRAGVYSAPNLQPGHYTVRGAVQGFSPTVIDGITLNVGGDLVIDLTLRAGGASEVVEVTDHQSDVELGSSELSSTVDARTVRELPLNGRDWTQLAQLEPGVDLVRTQPTLAINNTRENRGLGNSLTIGGARPQQNNYRLDGVSINDFANGAPGSVSGSVLGVDAVQEFSVITGNAPAEYGKEAGGIVNAVTRSGTNDLHGSAYEFLRNSVFDTRNYFDGPVIPSFKKNQFGASAGGPLHHGSTFLFGNYEGLRQGVGVTLSNMVPSPNARQGLLVCNQPATGTQNTKCLTAAGGTQAPPGSAGLQQYAIDPAVAPFLALWPLPNGVITGDTGNSSIVTKQITNEDFFTIKADQTFHAHDALALTYMSDTGQSTGPDSLADTLLGSQSRRQLATVADTHTFTPSLVSTLRAGYSRIVAQAPIAISALVPAAADTTLGAYAGDTAPAITVSGIAAFQGGIGANANWRYHYNSYQLYDDSFWTRGKHQVKFGVAFERIQSNEAGGGSPFGIYTFTSYANFISNKPGTFKGPLAAPINVISLRQLIAGAYIADDWRLTPKFTLNLGLRYEIATVPSEAHGRISTLAALGSLTNRIGNPLINNPTLKNFEPRVGFVWDPFRTGKTSVRGSVGLYDVLPLPYLFALTTLQSAPFFQQGSTTTPAAGSFPKGAVAQLSPTSVRYQYVQNPAPRNYVMQWSLGIQQELAPTLTLQLGYAGSHGVHQPFHGEDINTVQPALTPAGYVFPFGGTVLFPGAGQVSAVIWDGESIYHALNAKLTKRVSNGLQVQAAYTWAHSIDTSSASIAGDAFTNSIFNIPAFNPRLTRASSDYDVRNTFSASYTWQLPVLHHSIAPLRAVVNDWQSNSIFQAASGQPFSVGMSGDPLGLKSVVTYAFPDRIRNVNGCGTPTNAHAVAYIRTACFAFPSAGGVATPNRLGNATRNSILGPRLQEFDTSVFRNFPIPRISEHFNAQFRAECYNCINRTNFSSPIRANRDIFGQTGALLATAGIITTTATTSRQMQFALKLTW